MTHLYRKYAGAQPSRRFTPYELRECPTHGRKVEHGPYVDHTTGQAYYGCLRCAQHEVTETEQAP